MNALIKALFLSIILISVFSTVNATAAGGVMTAKDENGAHHANAGEKFFVHVSQDTNVSEDSNYALFFRWIDINFSNRSGSPKYWDLNLIDGNTSAVSDENVVAGRISQGPCLSMYHGGAINFIDMDIINFSSASTTVDAGYFDVNVVIPADANHADMNGKAGVLELWRLSPGDHSGAIGQYACTSMDANALFIIGPAIIVTLLGAPIEMPAVAPIDGNVTVFGYGFPLDANIVLKFADANGSYVDVNMLDVNSSAATNPYGDGPANERTWDQNGIANMMTYGRQTYNDLRDTNNLPKGTIQYTILGAGSVSSMLGRLLAPDANGEFDVNVLIPYTISLAGPGGVIPDNNIFADINGAFSITKYSDANKISQAKVIVTPGFRMSSDENVTVLVCTDLSGKYNCGPGDVNASTAQRVSIEEAMMSGWIRDQGNVKAIWVYLKDANVLVKMNSDVNISRGPRRDYSSNMVGANGKAKIDSEAMPEFGTDPSGNPIDANITMYNIKGSTGPIPYLARNGVKCPATICKNLDLGTFSYDAPYTATDGTVSWEYNTNAGDGNFSFRVSGFSEYSAGTLTATVTGDSNTGRTYFTRDGNLTVTFTYKDTNYQDQNSLARGSDGADANFAVSIYLSKTQCGQQYLLYKDFNILDNNGIVCTSAPSNFAAGAATNYAINDDDANISTTQTCSIGLDLARYADTGEAGFSHFTGTTGSGTYRTGTTRRFGNTAPDLQKTIMGRFYIDVNISAPRDPAVGNTLCATSDANTAINPPELFIWDTNFMNSHGSTFFDFNRLGGVTGDQNLAIDFNVRIQDTNMSLADLNLSIYYSQTMGDRNNVLVKDMNLMLTDANLSKGHADQNTVKCNYYSSAPIANTDDANHTTNRDTNCRFYLNAADLREGRYFIDMVLSPRTDNNRGAGSWAWDVNSRITLATTDYNSTANPAGINDTNIPVIRQLTGCNVTVKSTCAAVTVDANDTSNIKNFWHGTSTSGNYTDNGLNNLINFCIGTGESLPTTRTYYLKVSDFMDLNSAVSSCPITYESASGTTTGTTTPGTTGGTPGSTGGTPGSGGATEPTTETIVETTTTAPATQEEVAGILSEAGYTAPQIEKMQGIAEKTDVSQSIIVEKTTDPKITDPSRKFSYKTTITITVNNDSTKDWKNVSVVVEIPKTVAENASEITSETEMKVLKADPLIEFVVPQIKAGETAKIVYTLAKDITEAVAETIKAPFATGYTVVTVRPPASTCNNNGICEAGETTATCQADCLAPVVPPQIPPAAPAMDLTLPVIIIILGVVLIACGYYIVVSKKPKNKLKYK